MDIELGQGKDRQAVLVNYLEVWLSMQWWNIAVYAAVVLSSAALIYQFIKMRIFIKNNEEKTIAQVETQIQEYSRNIMVLTVITAVLRLIMVFIRHF